MVGEVVDVQRDPNILQVLEKCQTNMNLVPGCDVRLEEDVLPYDSLHDLKNSFSFSGAFVEMLIHRPTNFPMRSLVSAATALG